MAITYFVSRLIQPSFLGFWVVILYTFLINTVLVYSLGLDNKEKFYLKGIIHSFFTKFRK